MAARAMGLPLEACPETAKRKAANWRGGWRALKPAITWQSPADERRRKVSRVTRTRPGRGRSRYGRRSEWPDPQISLARDMHDLGYGPNAISAAVSAIGPNRSPQACSNRLNRLAKEAAP